MNDDRGRFCDCGWANPRRDSTRQIVDTEGRPRADDAGDPALRAVLVGMLTEMERKR